MYINRREGIMEMETAYVLNTRIFGNERGTGRHSSGVFNSADVATWHFLRVAEEQVRTARQRHGDFLCEVYRYGGEKPVSTFRIQVTDGCVLPHQPDCKCDSCAMLMSMTEELGDISGTVQLL
jgi:hypothetical protein